MRFSEDFTTGYSCDFEIVFGLNIIGDGLPGAN